MHHFVCVLAAVLCTIVDVNAEYQINVFPLNKLSNLDHFWESTGLCPPLPHKDAGKFLLSEDMHQNLVLIASTPHAGIKQVRVHWLLDLVEYDGKNYNFTQLDKFVSLLHKNNLFPGFEIMGNPSNTFTNFDNFTQVLQLKALVTEIAKRYITMFGLEYVKKWNFETWNEPDHGDFDSVKITVPGFLKYYDACSEGLKKADPSLVFGGPGGACKGVTFSKRCWALMSHCINGSNYITGKVGSRIDFISIHKKGNGKAQNILEEELETYGTLQSNFSELQFSPIYNDEADPLVGWSKPKWWRADATYAAVIAKVISQHQNQIIAKKNNFQYKLLSNDNGFLSFAPNYFTQRTLNARIQINNTDPKYVHFIKKPALVVMGLLAKLNDIQVNMKVSSVKPSTIGGIASICSTKSCQDLEISTILYNSMDTTFGFGQSFIELNFHDLQNTATIFYKSRGLLPPSDVKMMVCEVNNLKTNPYAFWKDMGSPTFPNTAQLKLLHAVEGPYCLNPTEISFNSTDKSTVRVKLPLPGVLLHQICWKPASFQNPPVNLQAHKINKRQVLLVWDDKYIQTKCIKTYVVQYAQNSDPQNYITINNKHILFNSLTFVSYDNVIGFFRVYAVDMWDRASPYSDVIYFQ